MLYLLTTTNDMPDPNTTPGAIVTLGFMALIGFIIWRVWG